MTNPLDGLKFDLGLGSTPGTPLASVSWTDVTSDVRLPQGVTFNRGRGSQDDAASPGRLTFTLNNGQATGKSVGRWTRNGANATSGWDLRIPVRVRHSTHGMLWVGYVDAAEAGWENGVRPTVRVSASDRLARFARVKMPGLLVGEILAADPEVYYPLDEPDGADSAGNRVSGAAAPLTIETLGTPTTEGVVFGSAAPDGAAPATGCAFLPDSSTVGFYLGGVVPQVTTSLGVCVVFQFRYPELPASTSRFLALGNVGGDTNPLVVAISTTGTLTVLSGRFSSVVDLESSVLEPGRWYSGAVLVEQVLGQQRGYMYLGGVLVDSYSGGTSTVFTYDHLYLGGLPNLAGEGGSTSTFTGNLANVAIYATGTAVDTAGWTDGFASDGTLDRWQRFCRLAGLDAADYAESGAYVEPARTMSAQPDGGKSYLDASQECAVVEDGVSFLDRTGLMRFHLRSVRLGATVGLSLGSADVESDLAVLSDTDRVINDLSVTRRGGATQRYDNPYSVAYYGAQDDSIDLACETDEQAINIAEWIVYERGYPDERVDSVTVDLVAKAATVDAADALTADVSTLLEVALPTPSAASSALQLFVEGISDSITETSWRRTFTTSNAAKRLDVFTLDDATLGVLDTGGVLA